MSDPTDIASDIEQLDRDDALRKHALRSGIAGKTIADSARHCRALGCGESISEERRAAAPGCRYCIGCQQKHERGVRP